MNKVKVGDVELGGGKIAVQSMTTKKASDVEESVAQILRMEQAGCEIVRTAVVDEEDARAIAKIKEKIHVPIVADIHFSARLAVLSAENGADKLRVNPGNIGGERELKLVADAIKRHKIPVRVGANTGSIEKSFFEKYGWSADALVESALSSAALFEKYGVEDIVISVKASDVRRTTEAYEKLHARAEYPLHLGVTEAGAGEQALIKSSIGIGALLLQGIGDTIRVSLTAEPEEEARAGHEILRACGLERDYVQVVSCPTCGRCRYDCMGLARRVNDYVKNIRKPLKIAVMGCVVNGPGEARDCDLGIAGGDGTCAIFQRGEVIERVEKEEAQAVFFARLDELLK